MLLKCTITCGCGREGQWERCSALSAITTVRVGLLEARSACTSGVDDAGTAWFGGHGLGDPGGLHTAAKILGGRWRVRKGREGGATEEGRSRQREEEFKGRRMRRGEGGSGAEGSAKTKEKEHHRPRWRRRHLNHGTTPSWKAFLTLYRIHRPAPNMSAVKPEITVAVAQAAGDLLEAGGSPLRDILAALPPLSHVTKAYGGSEGGAALAQSLASALGDGDLSVAEMDELGAWALVVASFVTLLVLGAVLAAVSSAAFGDGGLVGGGAAAGDRVLFLGPCRGGKTTLMYRLGGVAEAPETVTTMVPTSNTIFVDENGDEGDEGGDEGDGEEGDGSGSGKRLKVTDFPGHARMWSALRDHLSSARVVLFVVDAADLKSSNVQTAAELLFEVLTDSDFCDSHEDSGGIVIACNKADLSTAKAPEQVRQLLEAELEQLRVTRNAMGRVGGEFRSRLTICVCRCLIRVVRIRSDPLSSTSPQPSFPLLLASGDSVNGEDDGEEDGGAGGGGGGGRRVPLGQTGVKFSFASSAPCRVEFVSCSAKATGKKGETSELEDLRSTLADVFYGGD